MSTHYKITYLFIDSTDLKVFNRNEKFGSIFWINIKLFHHYYLVSSDGMTFDKEDLLKINKLTPLYL